MGDSVAGPLVIGPGVVIPPEELTWRFSRSSGPGGQSVNTTDSRVELRWDLDRSGAVTEWQRERLRQRLANRIVGGEVRIVAAEHRSQWQNRRAALRRLADLVSQGLAQGSRRRVTRTPRGAVERRLVAKRHRALLKQRRRRPTDE